MEKHLTLTLDKTKLQRHEDYYADTSMLGEFTDEFEPGYIVRGNHPVFVEDWPEEADRPHKGREYRCFIPPDNGEEIGTPDYRKYALEDYERMEAYQRNEWSYITVCVTTRISAKVDKATTLENCVNTVLCDVESDCNRVDIDGIIAELKAEHIDRLKEIGFSDEEIAASLDGFEKEEL